MKFDIIRFVREYTGSKFGFAGQRLDKFLVLQLKNLSRSRIQKMIGDGDILVGGKVKKAGYVLAKEDKVIVKDGLKAKKNRY